MAQLVGTKGALYLELDIVTGNATAISGPGLAGYQNVTGLAFDPNTSTLYGTDSNTGQLIVIDTLTGNAVAVGALGVASEIWRSTRTLTRSTERTSQSW